MKSPPSMIKKGRKKTNAVASAMKKIARQPGCWRSSGLLSVSVSFGDARILNLFTSVFMIRPFCYKYESAGRKAAKFSFILSIPIIILASMIYPLLELNISEVHTFNFKAMAVGCALSFITGFLCIKFFMKFLEKFSLKCFAWYCWVIGIIMIFVSLKAAQNKEK